MKLRIALIAGLINPMLPTIAAAGKCPPGQIYDPFAVSPTNPSGCIIAFVTSIIKNGSNFDFRAVAGSASVLPTIANKLSAKSEMSISTAGSQFQFNVGVTAVAPDKMKDLLKDFGQSETLLPSK